MRPPSLILIFRKESESEVKIEIQNLKIKKNNRKHMFGTDVRNRAPCEDILRQSQ